MGSAARDAADLAARLERIRKLTDELIHTQSDSVEARALAERMTRELDAARAALTPATRQSTRRRAAGHSRR